MQAFGKRMRGGLAALLSAALITSGALLAAPAAYAEEAAPTTEPAIAAETMAEAPVEAPAEEAPTEEAPLEDAPVEEAPAESDESSAPEDETAAEDDAPAAKDAPRVSSQNISTFAEAAPALIPTEAPRSGGEITVTGSGFAAGYPGIYLAIGPADLPGFYAGSSSLLDTIHISTLNAGEDNTPGARKAKMNADGSFSVTFTVPAFEEDKSYSLYASKAHGQGTSDTSQNVITAIDYAAPKVWAPAFSVELADGTPLAAGDKVYKGDKLVVKGTGFDPEANVGGRGMPIPATLPQGSYVTFTQAEPEWRPSENGVRIRNQASEKWLLAESVLDQVDPRYQGAIRNQWAPLAADGSWELELELKTPSNPTATGVYGVYSYAAGGVVNAAQELRFELDYTDTERPVTEPTFEPELKVFLADGTTPYTNQELKEGDKLVVKGSGYDPFANYGGIGQPIPADKPQGTFVVFGKFAENWKPSAGVTSSKRTMNPANRGWLLAESTLENDVPELHRSEIRKQWVELDEATGSFSWTVTLAEPETPLADGNWGIYTYAGGVNTKNAEHELSIPLNFKAKTTTDPEPPTATGSLQWGIYSQFRGYVESNEDGRVELLGAATRSGNVFGFTQAKGGNWNAQTETGELKFSGGVAFFAHGDALSLTIEDPILQVTASGAVLTARFDHGPQTPFADVDLSEATRTVAEDGSVTWAGAKTTMRAEGVEKFLGFYPAGTVLDPLTFTAGASADPTDPEPTTPKATVQSVKVVGDKLQVAGKAENVKGEVSVGLIERGTAAKAGGKSAILAQSDVKPSNGTASFSLSAAKDKLDRTKLYEVVVWPKGEAPNTGSILASANVNVTSAQWLALFGAPKPTDPENPDLAGGVLKWGVIEPFRNYVEGPIAHGEIRMLGKATKATNGVFEFPQAVGGSWNAEKQRGEIRYAGGVFFSGHDGALALSITDPQIKVIDASRAVLNAKVDGKLIPVANLDLSAAKRSEKDGAVTWAGATAALRAEAVGTFLDRYKAGTAMDPVTFTVGAAAVAPGDEDPSVIVYPVSVAGGALEVLGQAENLKTDASVALIERGGAGVVEPVAQIDPAVENGVAEFALTAKKDALDRTKSYEVVVWAKGAELDADAILAAADVNIGKADWDKLFGTTTPVAPPAEKSPAAGSLNWGVSTAFADYVTGSIAKGEIRTAGVGGGRGGYLFPQATGSSWNKDTRTGTVRYSGTVTFWGHGGLLDVTFANPVITVSNPLSGSITAGGQTFPLNLGAAGFTAHADGSVTWSNVPVSGAISGGDGQGAGGSLALDSLTFTVGSTSAANFGSTVTSPSSQERTPAPTPPATTGVTVVTPESEIVEGGEIEITASGFQPNEDRILVVIYSDPIVLDKNAKADANGVVRWIGKLPKGLTGKHTITLQGSINVGKEIVISAADAVKARASVTSETSPAAQQAAGIAPAEGTPMWVWWSAAMALLLVAGASTALVVAQRRKTGAPTQL